jgi:hypothetical protein
VPASVALRARPRGGKLAPGKIAFAKRQRPAQRSHTTAFFNQRGASRQPLPA